MTKQESENFKPNYSISAIEDIVNPYTGRVDFTKGVPVEMIMEGEGITLITNSGVPQNTNFQALEHRFNLVY